MGFLFCLYLAQMACGQPSILISDGHSTGKEHPLSLSTQSSNQTTDFVRDLGICSAPPGFATTNHVHGPSMVGLWVAVLLLRKHTTDRRQMQSHWYMGMMHGCALPHLQPGDNSGAIPVSKGQSFPPSFFQEFMPEGNRSGRVIYWGLVGKGAALERACTN